MNDLSMTKYGARPPDIFGNLVYKVIMTSFFFMEHNTVSCVQSESTMLPSLHFVAPLTVLCPMHAKLYRAIQHLWSTLQLFFYDSCMRGI